MTDLVKHDKEYLQLKDVDLKLHNKEYIQLIRDTYGKDLTELEFKLAIEAARHLRLDPVANQITFAKIQGRLTNIVRIDGFRLLAERTGEYLGQAPVLWCGPDGKWVDVWLESEPPAAAKATVLRRDREPMAVVARFKSYAKGSPNWRQMPDVMIAKCAEALAIRKMFPQETAGAYVDAELDRVRVAAPLPAPEEPELDAETKKWDAFCDKVRATKTVGDLEKLKPLGQALHPSYRAQGRAVWSNRLDILKTYGEAQPPESVPEPEILPGEPEPISEETQKNWGFSND